MKKLPNYFNVHYKQPQKLVKKLKGNKNTVDAKKRCLWKIYKEMVFKKCIENSPEKEKDLELSRVEMKIKVKIILCSIYGMFAKWLRVTDNSVNLLIRKLWEFSTKDFLVKTFKAQTKRKNLETWILAFIKEININVIKKVESFISVCTILS